MSTSGVQHPSVVPSLLTILEQLEEQQGGRDPEMRAALARLEEQLAGLRNPVPLPGEGTPTEQGVAAHLDMITDRLVGFERHVDQLDPDARRVVQHVLSLEGTEGAKVDDKPADQT